MSQKGIFIPIFQRTWTTESDDDEVKEKVTTKEGYRSSSTSMCL